MMNLKWKYRLTGIVLTAVLAIGYTQTAEAAKAASPSSALRRATASEASQNSEEGYIIKTRSAIITQEKVDEIDGPIIVRTQGECKLLLEEVSISDGIRIEKCSGRLVIELEGDCEIEGGIILENPDEMSLKKMQIQADDPQSSLVVYGGEGEAGIGGGFMEDNEFEIIIKNCIVEAEGGEGGAGIGGNSNSCGCSVTIINSEVSAEGGWGASDIGSGAASAFIMRTEGPYLSVNNQNDESVILKGSGTDLDCVKDISDSESRLLLKNGLILDESVPETDRRTGNISGEYGRGKKILDAEFDIRPEKEFYMAGDICTFTADIVGGNYLVTGGRTYLADIGFFSMDASGARYSVIVFEEEQGSFFEMEYEFTINKVSLHKKINRLGMEVKTTDIFQGSTEIIDVAVRYDEPVSPVHSSDSDQDGPRVWFYRENGGITVMTEYLYPEKDGTLFISRELLCSVAGGVEKLGGGRTEAVIKIPVTPAADDGSLSVHITEEMCKLLMVHKITRIDFLVDGKIAYWLDLSTIIDGGTVQITPVSDRAIG